jgi:hypothetical protein
MEYQICWFDPYDGRRDYGKRIFDNYQSAMDAAEDALNCFGADIAYRIVNAQTHRIVRH